MTFLFLLRAERGKYRVLLVFPVPFGDDEVYPVWRDDIASFDEAYAIAMRINDQRGDGACRVYDDRAAVVARFDGIDAQPRWDGLKVVGS